jgi:hypothetical protein
MVVLRSNFNWIAIFCPTPHLTPHTSHLTPNT